MLSIQSAKGVEIGDAIASAGRRGSSVHDEILYAGDPGYLRETDRAGGLEGGMTNGGELIVDDLEAAADADAAAAQRRAGHARAARGARRAKRRHRLPAAAVVAEAGVAFELARAALEKFGGDSAEDLVAAHAAYLERIGRA